MQLHNCELDQVEYKKKIKSYGSNRKNQKN
jgi:hypothetical protein